MKKIWTLKRHITAGIMAFSIALTTCISPTITVSAAETLQLESISDESIENQSSVSGQNDEDKNEISDKLAPQSDTYCASNEDAYMYLSNMVNTVNELNELKASISEDSTDTEQAQYIEVLSAKIQEMVQHVTNCPYCQDLYKSNYSEYAPYLGVLLPEQAPTRKFNSRTLKSTGPVVSDTADYDVFMNVDPSYGVDPNALSLKIQNYLSILIGGGQTYRFNTTAAALDPTDLTKWYLFDHFDTSWYSNFAIWKAGYAAARGLLNLPQLWYNTPTTANKSYVEDAYKNTTLKEMIDNNIPFGKSAQLREHIYADKENDKTFMQFYGYDKPAYADFLYYPASATSTKTVKFDVDATNAQPHSLSYAGFLINSGAVMTTDDLDQDSMATINGYALLFQYEGSPKNGGDPATSLNGVYLCKLTNVPLRELHTNGLSIGIDGVSLVGENLYSQSGTSFWKKSHIELTITPTGLKATMQELDDNGQLQGSPVYILGGSSSFYTLTDTGLGGFGPIVCYNSHNCKYVSAFRFSNLEMAFAEPLTGDSALNAYQFSDYLEDSRQRFFINLTDKNAASYAAEGNDTDLAYLSLIQGDKSVLLTDESGEIFPKTYLGENSKNVFSTNDVPDNAIDNIYSGSDPNEILAAKLAWLIYESTWNDQQGTAAESQKTVAANLMLRESSSHDSKQVSQVQRELIGSDALKIYLDNTQSTNTTGCTPVYTMTKPDGSAITLNPMTETDGTGRMYFAVDKSWPIGEYSVKLQYNVPITDPVTTSVPSSTKFKILSDTQKPTPVVNSISNGVINLSFTNNPSSGDNTYTSALSKYAIVITTDESQPSAPASDKLLDVSGTSASKALAFFGNLTVGTDYYAHVFLYDAAGNLGYAKADQKFTIQPTAISYQMGGTYTDESPFTGTVVSISITDQIRKAEKYQFGYADLGSETIDWGKKEAIIGDGTIFDYDKITIPIGHYDLYVRMLNGSDAQINTLVKLPVDNRYLQKFDGTEEYTVEYGNKRDPISHKLDAAFTYADGELSLNPNVIYSITSGDSVSIENGMATVEHYGATIIKALAAENDTHREMTKTITFNVVKPLSVKILSTALTEDYLTVVSTYALGAHEINQDTRILEYRKVGTEDWYSIAADNWNWSTGYNISFEELIAGADYELRVSVADNRKNDPYTVYDSLTFHVPETSSVAEGSGNAPTPTGRVDVVVTAEEPSDVLSDGLYTVYIKDGDAIIASNGHVSDNDDTEFTIPVNGIPDGTYKVVIITPDGRTITDIVTVESGQPAAVTIKAGQHKKSTQVIHKGEDTPNIAVGGLNEVYDYFNNTPAENDEDGLTNEDITKIVANGSVSRIDLIAQGVNEKTPGEYLSDVEKIQKASGGQEKALYIDLTLWKTIVEENDLDSISKPLKESGVLLTIHVPLPKMPGNNFKVYRVHENQPAAEIPQRTTPPEDGSEYCEPITGNEAVLHVKKFSLYAFAYTPKNTNRPITPGTNLPKPELQPDTNPETNFWDDVVNKIKNADKNDQITIDAADYNNMPDSVMEALRNRSDVSLIITWGDGTKLTIPAGQAISNGNDWSKTDLIAQYAEKPALSKNDHNLFIVGYPDNSIRPDRNMTRAEAAAMLCRLTKGFDPNMAYTASYSDVSADKWYANYIGFMEKNSIVAGYPDGAFRPDGFITRAEFATLAAKFDGSYTESAASFTDVPSDFWAADSIDYCVNRGWVTGYPDGTFKPGQLITRAEAVTVTCHMLERVIDEKSIADHKAELINFTDLHEGYWAYYFIVEATNAHEYTKVNKDENWTKVTKY